MNNQIKMATLERATNNQEEYTTKTAVLATLKKFRGWQHVSRQELAMFAHTSDRKMRQAIEELREEGHPICVTKDGTGYWYGTKREYEVTAIADYKSRIVSCAKKVNAFYGQPLEGQVTLDV